MNTVSGGTPPSLIQQWPGQFPMNDADREELMARRIAEKVAEDADKLIKRKYFWAAILFAGISWFGGAALITSIVQLRVIEKMEPHLQDLARAKATTDMMSDKLKEANKTMQAVEEKIDATKKAEAALDASVQALDEKLATWQARVTEVSTSGALATQQLNDRLKAVGAAVNEISVANRAEKTEAISRLDKPQIALRLGGDVPPKLPSELTEKLSDYLVTSEGPNRPFTAGSSLRYFYKSDAAMAEQIARKTEDALKQVGIDNKPMPTILTEIAIRPPERSFDLWINLSNGRLL